MNPDNLPDKNCVIPAQAGIQLIDESPRSGTEIQDQSSLTPLIHRSLNHVHIYLRPPTLLEIDATSHLLADGSQSSPATDTTTPPVTLQTAAQALLDYALTLTEGEELMFTMDVPYIPAQDTPIVLAQAAAPAAGANPQPDYILNDCQETESTGDPSSAMRTVNPAGMLRVFLQAKEGRRIDPSAVRNVAILQDATHGKITSVIDNTGRPWYAYDPTPNYIGNDRAVFLAEFEGKVYMIVVNLVVSLQVNENPLVEGEQPVCPPAQLIKVTKPSSGDSGYGTGYDLASASATFGDLAGGAVGQTTGTNITLDTNAANYNWFIDTTPADNSEYLPTSNPDKWVAKEGTDAYGKMDMLSVLLHEYGHALGIEHIADNHDYMATTLTPGVRRMPSADELALMGQLAAQAKDGLVGRVTPADYIQQTAGVTRPTTPDNSPMPIPLGANGALGAAQTLYAVAANATFANLDSLAGWNTQGRACAGMTS